MEDAITELIYSLKNVNCPILVEGKKDIECLEKLGITNVHPINVNKRSLVGLVTNYSSCKRVVVFTDFDRRGNELYKKLSESFEREGVKVIYQPRELLAKTPISHVEGLATYIQRRSF